MSGEDIRQESGYFIKEAGENLFMKHSKIVHVIFLQGTTR